MRKSPSCFTPCLLVFLTACTIPTALWANPAVVCANAESVRIEEAEGIFPPASVQVPGPDINSPAAQLQWTYLADTDNKLTAHCYRKLLDTVPFESASITGAKKCTYTGGDTKQLTCEK